MTTRGPAGLNMEEDHHRAASTSCVLHGGVMFKPQRTSSTLMLFLCTVRSETKSGNPFIYVDGWMDGWICQNRAPLLNINVRMSDYVKRKPRTAFPEQRKI